MLKNVMIFLFGVMPVPAIGMQTNTTQENKTEQSSPQGAPVKQNNPQASTPQPSPTLRPQAPIQPSKSPSLRPSLPLELLPVSLEMLEQLKQR